jgi:uncharacterized protein YjbJ (UPF0337 family)
MPSTKMNSKTRGIKCRVKLKSGGARSPTTTEIAGTCDQYIGLLEEKYGYTRERAEGEFDRRLALLRDKRVEEEFRRRLAKLGARQAAYDLVAIQRRS